MKAQVTIHLAVLAATAALVGGCSSTPPPPELAGLQVVPVQWTSLLSVPHGGGMKLREFHDQGLAGPHYTLGIAWVATGQSIDAKSASDLGIHPVRAAQGRDLVIVAVTPAAGPVAFKPSTPPPAELLIGGVASPLPGVPLADSGVQPYGTGALILASAAPHASLKLRVTDAGKAQELDLRTGAPNGDGYRQRQSAVSWQGQSPVVEPNANGIPGLGAGTLSVTNPGALSQPHTGDQAVLNNYQGGWAPQGQEFLTVPMPNLSGPTPPFGYPEVRFNDAAAFSFTPTHGRSTPAAPTAEDRPLSGLDLTDVSAVTFHVPDNTTAGTVTFDLRNSRLVDDHGKTFSWITPPQPFTLELSFTQ